VSRLPQGAAGSGHKGSGVRQERAHIPVQGHGATLDPFLQPGIVPPDGVHQEQIEPHDDGNGDEAGEDR
jgi:hypothetical protein